MILGVRVGDRALKRPSTAPTNAEMPDWVADKQRRAADSGTKADSTPHKAPHRGGQG